MNSTRMDIVKTSIVAMFVVLGQLETALAQTFDTVRVATYNVLNYPGSTSAARNPEFRMILRAIDPDVLIVQEMQSSSGLNEFLNQVLNFGQPGLYSAALFDDGPDSDNGLFYKSSRVSLQGQVTLSTQLRDINGYILRPAGVASDTLDFRVYSAHFKASQGFESDRLAEATIVRNHLNSLGPGHYIFGGDLNLYTSSEPAYDLLLANQADNDGRLYDIQNSPGSWHDNANFASVHTQSPRLTDLGDGGSTGGLDDRFDFLLPTYQFQSFPSWQVVAGSYTVFGNDGAHFGQSVNNGTNFAVPDSIADALHVSSDHLPVFVDIVRQVSAPPSVSLIQPNGGQSYGEGDSIQVLWNSQNYSGLVSLSLSRTGASGTYETIADLTANDGQFTWVVSGAPTNQARIKVVLSDSPAIFDVSDSDFAIFDRDLAVFTPAAGDSVSIGSILDIQWTAVNVSGNVRIELKRSPSTPGWELLSSSTPNSGYFGWIATMPASDSAIVRVVSVAAQSVGDSSGMFKIRDNSANTPPVILHNQVCDAVPGISNFFCHVQDDGDHDLPALLISADGFGSLDSVTLLPSSPEGFAVGISLDIGIYEYLLRVTDANGLSSQTDTFTFAVTEECIIELAYDDGSAESYQWSPDVGMSWAVRFSPTSFPFVLCAAEIAISAARPDSLHGEMVVAVLDINGIGGLPGDTIGVRTTGTLPNFPDGLGHQGLTWGRYAFTGLEFEPIVVNSDFYLAVSQARCAFGLDTNSAAHSRSFLWDSCENMWLQEGAGHENTRTGNRMIRATGYSLLPPDLVIRASGNDIVLQWSHTGASEYRIFRSFSPLIPLDQPVATTGDSTWTDVGVLPSNTTAFYVVTSALP